MWWVGGCYAHWLGVEIEQGGEHLDLALSVKEAAGGEAGEGRALTLVLKDLWLLWGAGLQEGVWGWNMGHLGGWSRCHREARGPGGGQGDREQCGGLATVWRRNQWDLLMGDGGGGCVRPLTCCCPAVGLAGGRPSTSICEVNEKKKKRHVLGCGPFSQNIQPTSFSFKRARRSR